jgi:hypothetical protein
MAAAGGPDNGSSRAHDRSVGSDEFPRVFVGVASAAELGGGHDAGAPPARAEHFVMVTGTGETLLPSTVHMVRRVQQELVSTNYRNAGNSMHKKRMRLSTRREECRMCAH